MDEKLPSREKAVSMKVLILGLCRTGTLSMKVALEELGYKRVYHFSTVDEDPSHANLWIQALRRKYEPPLGNSTENSKTDWDQLLGDYDAVTDIPAACFGPEIMAAYPNVKVILTTRSVISWENSMLNTIHALQSSYINRFLLSFADERTRNLSDLVDLIIKYYFRGSIPMNGTEVFEKHNEEIKEIALREKSEFLEFELGDGWGPLCEFLGKDVPSHEFPRINDRKSWRKAFRLDWYGNISIFLWVLGSFLIFLTLFMAQNDGIKLTSKAWRAK